MARPKPRRKAKLETCENCDAQLSVGADVCSVCNFVLTELLIDDFDPICSGSPKWLPDVAAKIRELSKTISKEIAETLSSDEPLTSENTAPRSKIRERVSNEPCALTMMERGILLQHVLDEICGFGPLGPFLRDQSVLRIYCAGVGPIFCERNGVLRRSVISFENLEHAEVIVERVLQMAGRTIDAAAVATEICLPNGNRAVLCVPPKVNQLTIAILPPNQPETPRVKCYAF